MARVLVSIWLEEVLAVVAAEEEGEAVQVAAQSVQAAGGVADVGQQRWRRRAGVGGASCDRRTAASRQAPRYDHHLGGGEPVHDPGSRTRAAEASIAVWDAPNAETPKRGVLARSSAQPSAGRRFHGSFAGDLLAADAQFLADSQVPWGVDALGGTIMQPAWRTKPSWYLLTTEDRMIPPPAQRMMAERAGATVVEVPASHSVFLSHPEAIAGLIRTALAETAVTQVGT